jgi:hypothetical protein
VKFFKKAKDGGPESHVTGYWLCEIKSLFSVALLKFEDGSRDSYHDHAFNSISWVLFGLLVELHKDSFALMHPTSLRPVLTLKSKFHKVVSIGTTWVLTFRGPWSKTWQEFDPKTKEYVTLTEHRKVVL